MVSGHVANLVRVSERSPVTESRAVLNKTPFCNPMLRNSLPVVTVPSSLSPPPMSTIHNDSGSAGSACILNGWSVSCTDRSHDWSRDLRVRVPGDREKWSWLFDLRVQQLKTCSSAGQVVLNQDWYISLQLTLISSLYIRSIGQTKKGIY